ncbi:hypothetical protein FA15DRAFT_672224 [Coprinopsis marcescibilis]|uniref:Uncharacterized protein n=1 Tax=Coprinopsis marcescibilis TaxID=230819 RepID=A0A5C3KN67_COPMA|nr:hypothetical protein FA15DRAFT_672224 [Coprinopsis marcescibilis]
MLDNKSVLSTQFWFIFWHCVVLVAVINVLDLDTEGSNDITLHEQLGFQKYN